MVTLVCQERVSTFWGTVVKVRAARGLSPLLRFEPPAIVWVPWLNLQSVILCPNNAKLVGWGMGMGFAPTWLRQVSPLPLLHMTTLTTAGALDTLPFQTTPKKNTATRRSIWTRKLWVCALARSERRRRTLHSRSAETARWTGRSCSGRGKPCASAERATTASWRCSHLDSTLLALLTTSTPDSSCYWSCPEWSYLIISFLSS